MKKSKNTLNQLSYFEEEPVEVKSVEEPVADKILRGVDKGFKKVHKAGTDVKNYLYKMGKDFADIWKTKKEN